MHETGNSVVSVSKGWIIGCWSLCKAFRDCDARKSRSMRNERVLGGLEDWGPSTGPGNGLCTKGGFAYLRRHRDIHRLLGWLFVDEIVLAMSVHRLLVVGCSR